jgi:hypothetical protein
MRGGHFQSLHFISWDNRPTSNIKQADRSAHMHQDSSLFENGNEFVSFLSWHQ